MCDRLLNEAIRKFAWYGERKKAISLTEAKKIVCGLYSDHTVTTSGTVDLIYDVMIRECRDYIDDKEVFWGDGFEEGATRALAVIYLLKRRRNQNEQLVFFGAITTCDEPKLEYGYVRIFDIACKLLSTINHLGGSVVKIFLWFHFVNLLETFDFFFTTPPPPSQIINGGSLIFKLDYIHELRIFL